MAEARSKQRRARISRSPRCSDEIFSLAANTHQTTDDLLDAQYDYFRPVCPHAIADLQKRYTARKRATNAMDFDDLLALWLTLLQEHAEVREHYQRRFQFILVDEYQDTNQLQSDLIDLLAGRHHNVMVVGDDAQSIYAWRGANFQNIFKFPNRYPGAKTFKIETNYRSTPEILKVANAAIAANTQQFTKELAPARKSGLKPALVACMDAAQQAAFIAQRVGELAEEGVNLNQVAVLYRSHFHALELQLELTRRQIPFSITSGIRFFEQAHIKDATAYLKLVANPRDEIAFKRLAQLLPGIGAKGADKLWRNFLQVWSRGNETRKIRRRLPIKTQRLLTSDSTKSPLRCKPARNPSRRRRRSPGRNLRRRFHSWRRKPSARARRRCCGWCWTRATTIISRKIMTTTATGWKTLSNSPCSRFNSAPWRIS